MANNFSNDKHDIIVGALRKIGAISKDDVVVDGTHYAQASAALNTIILDLCNTLNVQLWNTENTAKTFIVGDLPVITITPASDTLSIEKVLLRDSNGNDTVLTPLTEAQYLEKADKAESDLPSSYWFDMKYPTSKIYFLPYLNDETYSVIYSRTVQIPDLNDNSDIASIPKRGQRTLIYTLADDLADEYTIPINERNRISAKATVFMAKFKSSLMNKERGDKFIYPSDAFI